MNTLQGAMAQKRSSKELLVTKSLASRSLDLSAKFWFVVTVIGQWLFLYYVAFFYGGSALSGNLEKWGEVLPHGIMEGDGIGNFALAGHILLAIIIFVFGPIQLVPQIRAKALLLHKWSGRIYIPAVFLTSLFGLYMVWTRGTVGDMSQTLGITGDAILIMLFSILTWQTAVKKKLKTHRKWALRLFMVASGVWFFRIGLMCWFMLTGGVGVDVDTFTGPFLSFWTFGQYLLPLAILELYFLAQKSANSPVKLSAAVLICVMTLLMGVGIFAATMGMWLPRVG